MKQTPEEWMKSKQEKYKKLFGIIKLFDLTVELTEFIFELSKHLQEEE